MKTLSDKAGLLIVANFTKYAVSFIMPMVMVRMLSQVQYGSYQQLNLISASLNIMTLGLPTSVYYFYQHADSGKRDALLVQTAGMLIVSGIVTGIALTGLAPLLAAHMNNPGITGLFMVYAWSVAFLIAGEHATPFLISQDRYTLAVAFEIGETVARVAILLVPLWFGWGLAGIVGAAVAYAALRWAIRNAVQFSLSRPDFARARANFFIREQLTYGLPVALTSVVGLVGALVDRVLIAVYFTPAQFAIYSVGALQIPLDGIFQSSVANVLRATLPTLVRDNQLAEVARLVRESVRKLALIVLPSFVFLLGYSENFITIFFTTRYEESVQIFRIYMCMVPLHMFILSPIPQVFGKTRANLYIVASMGAFTLVSSVAFLKWFGFYGPALAVVCSEWIQVTVYLGVALRLTHARVSMLVPWNPILRILVASGIAFFLSTTFPAVPGPKLLDLTLRGVAFSVAFAVGATLVRALTTEDRALIWRWVRRALLLRSRPA